MDAAFSVNSVLKCYWTTKFEIRSVSTPGMIESSFGPNNAFHTTGLCVSDVKLSDADIRSVF